jgi:hypothetical protein
VGTVYYDQGQVPVKVEDSNGQAQYFDRDKLIDARTKAMSSPTEEHPEYGMAQVAQVIIADEGKPNKGPEIKLPTEPAADTLTEEELVSRGVTIIQPEGSTWSFRKGAFEEGGLFSGLKLGSENKLMIVFLNSVTVNGYALRDKRYEIMRGLLGDNGMSLDEYKASEYAWVEDQIRQIIEGIKDSGADEIDAYDLIDYGAEKATLDSLTPDQWQQRMMRNAGAVGQGAFCAANQVEQATGIENTSVIFIPTGDSDNRGRIPVIAQPNGSFVFGDERQSNRTADMRPKPTDQLVEASDLSIDKKLDTTDPRNAGKYKITGGMTAEGVLVHELGHWRNRLAYVPGDDQSALKARAEWAADEAVVDYLESGQNSIQVQIPEGYVTY